MRNSIFELKDIGSPLGNWMEEIEAQRELERQQRLELDRIRDKYNIKIELDESGSSKKIEIAYFTIDGEYLGMVEGNAEIRVVDWSDLNAGKIGPIYGGSVPKDWVTRQAFVDLIHKVKINYRTLTSYSGTEDNFGKVSSLTLDQMMDLMHVMYGELKGKDAANLAHVMLNREIFMSKWLKIEKSIVGTGMGQSPRHKLPNLNQWDYLQSNGFPTLSVFDYSLATLHLWYPDKFQIDPKTGKGPYGLDFLTNQLNIIRKGLPALETDKKRTENKGYKDFYNLKSKGIQYLYQNSGSIEWNEDSKDKKVVGLAKAIIEARTGLTKDPLPNHIGWNGNPIQWTEHKKAQIDTEKP